MKAIIILLIFLHCSLCFPRNTHNYAIVLDNGDIKYNLDLNDQKYSYSLKTSDGTEKHETGQQQGDNLIVEGGYEFVAQNGVRYSVTYSADKNGYRPKITFGASGKTRPVGPLPPPVLPPGPPSGPPPGPPSGPPPVPPPGPPPVPPPRPPTFPLTTPHTTTPTIKAPTAPSTLKPIDSDALCSLVQGGC